MLNKMNECLKIVKLLALLYYFFKGFAVLFRILSLSKSSPSENMLITYEHFWMVVNSQSQKEEEENVCNIADGLDYGFSSDESTENAK